MLPGFGLTGIRGCRNRWGGCLVTHRGQTCRPTSRECEEMEVPVYQPLEVC